MGETKTSCKQFVAAYQQQTEYLRNELPIGVCNQILGTQHRSNINTLQKFISKSQKDLNIWKRRCILYIRIAVDVFGLHLREPDASGSFFCCNILNSSIDQISNCYMKEIIMYKIVEFFPHRQRFTVGTSGTSIRIGSQAGYRCKAAFHQL